MSNEGKYHRWVPGTGHLMATALVRSWAPSYEYLVQSLLGTGLSFRKVSINQILTDGVKVFAWEMKEVSDISILAWNRRQSGLCIARSWIFSWRPHRISGTHRSNVVSV